MGRRAATAGAGDTGGPFGRGRLARGQRVTWFYCVRAADCQRTLEVSAKPATGGIVATVRGYDDDGDGVPVVGATVTRRARSPASPGRTAACRWRSAGHAPARRAQGWPRAVVHRASRGAVRRARALAAAAVVLAGLAPAAAGCGFGEGGEKKGGGATLRVTRDFGHATLGSVRLDKVHEGDTVMRMLRSKFDVTTRFGGRFVQSIDGLAGQGAGGQVDWFFFVNGVEADKGAAEWHVSPGDRDPVGPARLGRGDARAGDRGRLPGAVHHRRRAASAAR